MSCSDCQCQNESILPFNYGSDLDHKLVYKNEDNTVIDLTGYTVSFLEASPLINENATLSISDALAGEISFSMKFMSDIKRGRMLSYICQFKIGSETFSSPKIIFEID